MIRNLGIFFSILLILAIGTWTQILRRENARLEERVHHLEQRLRDTNLTPAPVANPAPAPVAAPLPSNRGALEAELLAEQQKLADLETKLQASAPTNKDNLDAANKEIASLKPRIAQLQTTVAQLNDDSKTVNERSGRYRDQQMDGLRQSKAQIAASIAPIEQQLRDLGEQIKTTQATRATPYRKQALTDLRAQADALRGQRRDLEAQSRQIDQTMKQSRQAITNEVNAEQGELRTDKQNASAELADLKRQIQHWESVRSAYTGGAVNVTQIREDIAQSKVRIQSLTSQIQAIH